MTNVIAIDGPASVGKSSLAKMISKKYNYPVLHSGKLYRLVSYYMLFYKVKLKDRKNIINCINKIDENDVEPEALYNSRIDKISSEISSKEFIRKELKKYQRRYVDRNSNGAKFIVVEGRDIGTIIFPEAKYKIFMWADLDVRAKRRFQQIQKKGSKYTLDEVKKEIKNRDKRDLNRKTAPLKPDVNSVLLDTSYLDIEQSFNTIKIIINH